MEADEILSAAEDNILLKEGTTIQLKAESHKSVSNSDLPQTGG
jgi:hypothetical protein